MPSATPPPEPWLRSRDCAWVILAVSSSLRLWFVWSVHPPGEHIRSDMWVYHRRAHNLLSGQLDAWDTFTPVGYPALLALLYGVWPAQHALVAAVQALSGGATCALTHRLGCRMSQGVVLPLSAALVSILHLPAILYTGLLLTETVSALGVVASLWLLLRSLERPLPRRWLAAGLCMGAAAVIRPNMLAAFALCVPACLWLLGRTWRMRRRALMWLLLGALPLLLAASLHNSRIRQQPTGLATNGGLNFYLNLAEVRSIHYRDPRGHRHQITPVPNLLRYERDERSAHALYDQGHFFARGLALIQERPGRLLRTLRNVPEWAGVGRMAFWPGWRGHDRWLEHYATAFFWLLLLPAGLRAGRVLLWPGQLQRQPAELLSMCMLLGSLAVGVLFLADPRIRVPFDALVGLLALRGAGALWHLRQRTQDTS